MHVVVKRDRVTLITDQIEVRGRHLRCEFYPASGKLYVRAPFERRRVATREEEAKFRFEVFGKTSETSDEFERQQAAGKVNTGTRVKAARFERARILVEEALD